MMRLRINSVVPDDPRTTPELVPGEVVHHQVELQIEGESLTFDVALRAGVLGSFDAGVLYGDEALEELLRFSPADLNAVLGVVGRVRRGQDVQLPLDIDRSPFKDGARTAP